MRGNNSNKTVSKKQHPICLKFEEMYNLEKCLKNYKNYKINRVVFNWMS